MSCPAAEIPTFPMPRESPFDPPPEILRLLSEEPISRVRLWNGQESWILTRYEDIRTVLASPHVSADVRRDGYPKVSAALAQFTEGLLNHMDSPEHDRYRKMFVPKFMVKRMEALRPQITATVGGLVDAMIDHGPPVDLVHALALPVPGLAVSALLGVPVEEQSYFSERAESCLSGDLERARAASQDLHVYLTKLVADKQENPGDDLISQLVVDHVRTGALDADDLVIQARLMLVAGFDTTANMISLGLLTLMQHPEQFEALKADPQLIPVAIEELLRYLTVTHRGRHRVATADIEVGGQLIRAGEGVIAAQDAANRDPDAFPDPNTLDIRRPGAHHHLAFGYGPHQCLGATLARVELQVAYAAVLSRLPNLRLAVPLEEIEFKHDSAVYGVQSMPVEW